MQYLLRTVRSTRINVFLSSTINHCTNIKRLCDDDDDDDGFFFFSSFHYYSQQQKGVFFSYVLLVVVGLFL